MPPISKERENSTYLSSRSEPAVDRWLPSCGWREAGQPSTPASCRREGTSLAAASAAVVVAVVVAVVAAS